MSSFPAIKGPLHDERYMKMRFGVVGSAHGHIFTFIRDMLASGGEFVGIFDDGSENVHLISEQQKVPVFSDMDTLFAQKIDIAGTSAINSQKIGIIEACARHGVHIMADKPIVVDESQLVRLERVINTSTIQVGLMLSLRFLPEVITLKRLIDDDLLGRLISVEIFNPHKLNPETRPDWHFDKSRNGGIAIDLFPHSIDIFQWLTGSKITNYNGVIVKSTLYDKPDFYDSSQFLVFSESGVSGYFRVDWHMPAKHWSWGDIRIFCTGTKGMAEIRASGDPITREQSVILYRNDAETAKADIVSCDKTETTDFIGRIAGKGFSISHEDILSASRLAVEFDKCARIVRI